MDVQGQDLFENGVLLVKILISEIHTLSYLAIMDVT